MGGAARRRGARGVPAIEARRGGGRGGGLFRLAAAGGYGRQPGWLRQAVVLFYRLFRYFFSLLARACVHRHATNHTMQTKKLNSTLSPRGFAAHAPLHIPLLCLLANAAGRHLAQKNQKAERCARGASSLPRPPCSAPPSPSFLALHKKKSTSTRRRRCRRSCTPSRAGRAAPLAAWAGCASSRSG